MQTIHIINEESTVGDLQQQTVSGFPDTKKRQKVKHTVSVGNVQFIPYDGSGALLVKSEVTSFNHKYTPVIQFNQVEYVANDSQDVVTFPTESGEKHIIPVNDMEHNVQVRCNCMDFYWRFARRDSADNSLYGDPPGLYRKKTNRPPANPNNVVGMCKHLFALVDELKRIGILK